MYNNRNESWMSSPEPPQEATTGRWSGIRNLRYNPLFTNPAAVMTPMAISPFLWIVTQDLKRNKEKKKQFANQVKETM